MPDQLRSAGEFKINHPIKCQIELSGSAEMFDFHVMLITDKG